nr:hypothetical protein CPAG_04209 [Coccidioides posadasii RMSCC 3488]
MSGVKNDEMFGLKSYSTTGPSILYNQEGEDGLKGVLNPSTPTGIGAYLTLYHGVDGMGFSKKIFQEPLSEVKMIRISQRLLPVKQVTPRTTSKSEASLKIPKQGGRMKHEALTAHGKSKTPPPPPNSRIPRARLIGLEGAEDVPTIQLGKFPGVELPQGVTDTSA